MQTALCSSNDTDSFNVSALVRTKEGLALNFTSNAGQTVAAKVACDPLGRRGVVEPRGPVSVQGSVTQMDLQSLCACPDSCGSDPIPRANPACGYGDIDLSSAAPTTFTASNGESSGKSGLWYFSPCGVTSALCPNAPPAFFSGKVRRRGRGFGCDGSRSYETVTSVALLPDDTGLSITYESVPDESSYGPYATSATAFIYCDKKAPRLGLEALGMPRQVWTLGSNRFFNLTSRCACPGACPQRRDYWVLGPGQSTRSGSTMAYPEDYPGRTMDKHGVAIGQGISHWECAGACDSLPGRCVAFTYRANDKTCFLHSGASCETAITQGINEWNSTTNWLVNGGNCPQPAMTPPAAPAAETHVRKLQSLKITPQQCSKNTQTCLSGTTFGHIKDIADHSTCCQMCAVTTNCIAFQITETETGQKACDLLSETAKESAGNCTSGRMRATTTTTTTTTTPDLCTIAGMHFQNIPAAKIMMQLGTFENSSRPLNPNISDMEWQLSLCQPMSAACATEGPAFLRMKSRFPVSEGCLGATAEFGQRLNFTVGSNGVDFLFAQPGLGLARVSIECDKYAPEVPEPAMDSIATLADSSAPEAFYTLRLRSRCACNGVCGPPAPSSEKLQPLCHVDGKNFTSPAPLRFVVPVNLTDGWFNGTPVLAPPGLRGEEPHVWSVSLCESVANLCAEPRFISIRPQNASWCHAGGLFEGIESRAWLTSASDVVEFGFKSAKSSATVRVLCDGSQGKCEGEGGLRTTMDHVEATGAGTDHIHYKLDLRSPCACNLPTGKKVRYHCIRDTQQCVEDTTGHHSKEACLNACGSGLSAAFFTV